MYLKLNLSIQFKYVFICLQPIICENMFNINNFKKYYSNAEKKNYCRFY